MVRPLFFTQEKTPGRKESIGGDWSHKRRQPYTLKIRGSIPRGLISDSEYYRGVAEYRLLRGETSERASHILSHFDRRLNAPAGA